MFLIRKKKVKAVNIMFHLNHIYSVFTEAKHYNTGWQACGQHPKIGLNQDFTNYVIS